MTLGGNQREAAVFLVGFVWRTCSSLILRDRNRCPNCIRLRRHMWWVYSILGRPEAMLVLGIYFGKCAPCCIDSLGRILASRTRFVGRACVRGLFD
jgi:hypothetical protein